MNKMLFGLLIFLGFSTYGSESIMKIDYGCIVEVETDVPGCVLSKETTIKFEGAYDGRFLVGWYSNRIGSVVESCYNDYSSCILSNHGNRQDIDVVKIDSNILKVSYCDYE